MAEAASESQDRLLWRHTDALMVIIHNVNCTKQSDMKPPGYFNPYEDEKQIEAKPEPYTPELRDVAKKMMGIQ